MPVRERLRARMEAAQSFLSMLSPEQRAQMQAMMQGMLCGECGNHAVIKKDGCDFCTACGAVGSCG